MSTAQVVSTKNLFINSETVLVGNCRDVIMNLPQQFASCQEHQNLRLTLQTFSMRKNWYNINQGNNKFSVLGLQGAAMISEQIEIPIGNYQSYDDANYGICEAILGQLKAKLVTAPFSVPAADIANSTCTWDYITNRISIVLDLSNAAGGAISNVKLVTFTISDYNPSTVPTFISRIIGQDYQAAFQSNWQIMGGCNVDNQTVNLILNTATDTVNLTALRGMYSTGATQTGFWRAELDTEENIFMRSDINTDAMMTSGFDANSSLYPYIVSSSILAKIPIQSGLSADTYASAINTASPPVIQENYMYQDAHQQIQYMDNGNNVYSVLLSQKHLSQLRIYLTDRYGMHIPISQEQLSCDGSPFTATIRVDVLE